MLRWFRVLILSVLPLGLLAEGVSWNLGVLSNYGHGQQLGLDYNYLENFLSASANAGPWYLDLKLEYSEPPEYGFAFTGVNRALLRYSQETWTLEAGDIAAVFGRGLALNLYENQAIDFNNQLRGARFTASLLEHYEVNLIAGANQHYRFYSPSSEQRQPDGTAAYALAGLETAWQGTNGNLAPYFIGSQLRSDYQWRTLDPNQGGVTTDTVTQVVQALQAGWGQSYYGESWDLYLEYNRTWKAFDYPLVQQNISQDGTSVILQTLSRDYQSAGQALDVQLNWFPDWFTVMFEYRRYLNGPESSAAKRNPLLLASKPLPWQLGPTGIRQHDIALLANVTHPVDYGDELGWNLELQRNLSTDWSLIVNAAQTSQARDSRTPGGAAGFIPRQELTRNPWREVYAEVEFSGEQLSQRMFLAYTQSVLSGANAAEITRHFTLVPAYLAWHNATEFSWSAVIELQRSQVSGETYTGEQLDGHTYGSAHVITSLDLQQKYSAAVIWDTSTDPNLNGGTDAVRNWVSTELSVKPLAGFWLRASYGKEQGGVRCTGGVCRVLNPFEGFRMTLEWRL